MPADLPILALPVVAVFGVVFGSFLNVCIYRIPRDLSVVAPRSFCPECGRLVAWYDNIPLLSYLFLKGRCRYCSKQIGPRYFLVELITAILFVLVAAKYGSSAATLKWFLFEAFLIVLFWTDLEERILPDEITLGGAVLGFLVSLFVVVPGGIGQLILPGLGVRWQSVFSAAAGALLLALPIWLLGGIYARLRKREGLGAGDVKLLVMLGVFLGPERGLFALLIGAVGGSVAGIAYVLWTRKNASSYQLPFGTFLCAGAALVPLLPKNFHFPLDVF